MLKDFFNHIRLVNKADDPHLSLALGTGELVCLIDLFLKYDQRFFNSFDIGWAATSMTSGFQLTSPFPILHNFIFSPLDHRRLLSAFVT